MSGDGEGLQERLAKDSNDDEDKDNDVSCLLAAASDMNFSDHLRIALHP